VVKIFDDMLAVLTRNAMKNRQKMVYPHLDNERNFVARQVRNFKNTLQRRSAVAAVDVGPREVPVQIC